MSEQVDTFLAITGSSDAQVAENFLEMAGNNLETAISLFFEHGPSNGSNSVQGHESTPFSGSESDAALAERLQNEAYQSQQDNQTRAPDEAVHERLIGDDVRIFPGTFGGVGGAFNSLLNHGRGHYDDSEAVFGSSRRGIFNQTDIDDDISDDDRLEEVDSDGEPIQSGLSDSQRRLAKIFRPPFDLMFKANLDTAKRRAREEKKWLLVNIQDNSDFQCQILNRDFWSNSSVKEIVKEQFIFLQYANDATWGQEYTQFYSFDKYPHIAILDPMTGERLKMWSEVPKPSSWVNEVYDFLNQFSLDPASVNPIVQHKKKIDPTGLTEEQQLEYAIKQSLGNKDDDDRHDVEILNSGNREDPIDIEDETTELEKELTEEEQVKQIQAIAHQEPEGQNATITRVQIRTGDGKRIVRKFKIDDRVLVIYETVKALFEEIGDNFFTLTSQRENLFPKLNETINDAGLKNTSLLLEIVYNE